MVSLTDLDNVAISNAVWSHPQGVSFNAKLTQIAECCQRMGQKRSGVVRLWMYQLYEDSIREDHIKRGLIKEEKEETPQTVPQAKLKAVKKVKPKPRRRAARRVEQRTLYPNLPHYAPVFVRAAENEEIIGEIDEVLDNLHRNPLKLIKPKIEVKKVNIDPEIIELAKVRHEKEVQKQVEITRKKRKKKEWLLLMAA